MKMHEICWEIQLPCSYFESYLGFTSHLKRIEKRF